MTNLIEPDDLPKLLGASWSTEKNIVTVGGAATTEGWELGFHSHAKAQLLFVVSGFVTSEVESGIWLVPPGSALFIAGGSRHRLTVAGEVRTYVTLIDSSVAPDLPAYCRTISVTPLLRALVLKSSEFSVTEEPSTTEIHVGALLLSELASARQGELHLPMPTDPRLRQIFDGLIAHPSERLTVEEWARRSGLGRRTLERMILAETGLSFSRWREQLNLLLALRWMAEGRSVQQVAIDLGFESSGSFVTMFRRLLGSPPKRYMDGTSSDAFFNLRSEDQ